MKDQIKRWNQLAGTESYQNKNSNNNTLQEHYGNAFVQEQLQLNEDIASKLADKQKDKDADGGDLEGEEKATVSDSELKKNLKASAGSLADAVPTMMNDEFVEIINKVKDLSDDKAKINKLIKFIERLG
ncbi:MAG: hypothetical protein CBB97_07050 [Candidatus Endolissoclinum sp. TMED37]|nr:MAG: hypothetical protein CBB97_07050 [Candidatus Endolissoclinum sp. TMED37]